jgi:hypothetical protein
MNTFYIRHYMGTFNLGDAIQTLALSRLLPGSLLAWPGDQAANPAIPFVVNGWLGRRPVPTCKPAAVAGVFLSGGLADAYGSWLAGSGSFPIGARDPWTVGALLKSTMNVDLVGCATLTLPRYRGNRSGTVRIDGSDRDQQYIDGAMPWEEQWERAVARIDELRKAAVVYTGRLHVALPCLAMGTPVCYTPTQAEGSQRFSLLNAIGVPRGEVVSIDVSAWADRYKRFLSARLGIDIDEHDAVMPC